MQAKSPDAHKVSEPIFAALPIFSDRAAARAAASLLAPRVAMRAARTEADRRVTDETIGELIDSGLFGLVMSQEYGGSGLGMAALVDVTSVLANACGSTGWVFGVLAGHSWLLNLFPAEAQGEVHADPRALVATVFRLSAKIEVTDGGFQLTQGTGRFCSGIHHAKWVILTGSIHGAPNDPTACFYLIPREDIEIVDDWYTAGMRGTGSCTIRIAKAFIPSYRSISLEHARRGTSPGAQLVQGSIYRAPFHHVAPFSIIGAPLGLAQRAVHSFCDGLKQRLADASSEQIAEHSTTIARIGHAAADVDAAFALVLADAELLDAASNTQPLSALQEARLARNWSYAAHQSRYAVDSLFEAAGGSGIFDTSELQRIWRDVNSAAQHYAFGWDAAMTRFGRAALAQISPPSDKLSP